MEEILEKKGKKKKSILWLIILLLLILLGIGAGMFYQYIQNSQKDRLARDELALGGMLPGKSQQEITELLNAKVEEGMVDIGMSAEPIFEYNGKKGRLGIENIAANHYSFQVTIKLDETDEKIYESGIIDPGYYIEYAELEQTLQAGDYPATATFTTYSLDETEDKIAEIKVKLKLHVMDGKFYQ
jgi:cell division protein YceG involved in septum cleavage